MYLYYNVLININPLVQLVKNHTTNIHCTVTINHIAHSYGHALLYIHHWHEARHRWVHACILETSMDLFIWLYTMSIIVIWYHRGLLVIHVIIIYAYIARLRHVSYHHICTHCHLLINSNVTRDCPLLSLECPNNNTVFSQYYAAQQSVYGMLWGSFFFKPRISYQYRRVGTEYLEHLT